MARRPVFIPDPEGPALVQTRYAEFQWHPGLAVAQKQRSIQALHAAARDQLSVGPLLEISSKSLAPLGVALSAFNLTYAVPSLGRSLSVECVFQGSKVFERGGPYIDLFGAAPRDAKRDERLKSSGNLKAFRFEGVDWPLEPQTAFYDWLYILALKARPDLAEQVQDFAAFTDIEFNPEKSINCQAYSVALFLSLDATGLMAEATRSQEAFLSIVGARRIMNARQDDTIQGNLF